MPESMTLINSLYNFQGSLSSALYVGRFTLLSGCGWCPDIVSRKLYIGYWRRVF